MLDLEIIGRLPKELSPADRKEIAKTLTIFFRLRTPVHVFIRIVSESIMKTMNKTHRQVSHATDVLSFANAEAIQSLTPTGMSADWGEIVLCPTYARREAHRREIDPREEFIRLIIHGTLHLRGYDHAKPKEEAKMFALQERLISHVLPPPFLTSRLPRS